MKMRGWKIWKWQSDECSTLIVHNKGKGMPKSIPTRPIPSYHIDHTWIQSSSLSLKSTVITVLCVISFIPILYYIYVALTNSL